MSKERFETVLDYGFSKLRIGTFDNDHPNNKFFLNEEFQNNFSFENSSEKIHKLVKKLEKKQNTHLNDVNIMIDTPDFFCVDIGLKKNFNNRLVKSNDIKHLLNITNSLIKNNYSNIKIIHFIITKITIDKKDLEFFPEKDFYCYELIFEAKFICLPDKLFDELFEKLKTKYLSIKKIYCTSYIKSFCFKDSFENYENKFFLDIGYEKSCLAIYKKNKLKLIKYIQLGGNHITKDISKIFKISLNQAEQIKKSLGNLNLTFSDKTNEESTNKNESFPNIIFDNKIEIELLKRVVFARIDEIMNLIFDNINGLDFIESSNDSILVFTGEGSKILNKNSIIPNNKFSNFKELNFFNENTTLVCDSGYKYIFMDKPNEVTLVPKRSDKYGFFEKMFNFFK